MYLKDVKGEIYSWSELVDGLVNEVLSSFGGFQADSGPWGGEILDKVDDDAVSRACGWYKENGDAKGQVEGIAA
jgi:hypothetical protein